MSVIVVIATGKSNRQEARAMVNVSNILSMIGLVTGSIFFIVVFSIIIFG